MTCCVQGEGARLGAARAEALLRRLVPDLAPSGFQHLMRILRNDIFRVLDPTGAGRQACICSLSTGSAHCAKPDLPFVCAPLRLNMDFVPPAC